MASDGVTSEILLPHTLVKYTGKGRTPIVKSAWLQWRDIEEPLALESSALSAQERTLGGFGWRDIGDTLARTPIVKSAGWHGVTLENHLP